MSKNQQNSDKNNKVQSGKSSIEVAKKELPEAITSDELEQLNELFATVENQKTTLGRICLQKEIDIKAIQNKFDFEYAEKSNEIEVSNKVLDNLIKKLNKKYGNSTYNLANGKINRTPLKKS